MRTTIAIAAVLVAGCAGPRAAPESPADAFLAAFAGHCGQAFEGRIVANQPATPNDPFDGKTLVMHVRDCSPTEVRVPFHVGEDRSRTWVIKRTAAGLDLRHDHRHVDGTPDAVTMYGGETRELGTSVRQEFPVDAFSKTLFVERGLNVSITNTWAVELHPGERYVYELSRPGRLFRVEFDLRKPVALPPPVWGYE
jgi:hypothetical protein